MLGKSHTCPCSSSQVLGFFPLPPRPYIHFTRPIEEGGKEEGRGREFSLSLLAQKKKLSRPIGPSLSKKGERGRALLCISPLPLPLLPRFQFVGVPPTPVSPLFYTDEAVLTPHSSTLEAAAATTFFLFFALLQSSSSIDPPLFFKEFSSLFFLLFIGLPLRQEQGQEWPPSLPIPNRVRPSESVGREERGGGGGHLHIFRKGNRRFVGGEKGGFLGPCKIGEKLPLLDGGG